VKEADNVTPLPRKTGPVTRKRAQTVRMTVKRGAITCKSPFRHAWEAIGPIPHRRVRRSFGTLVTFRCAHCQSYRFWILSRLTGEKLYGWYEHSDEYRELLNLGLSVNEWRAAWMDEMDKSLMEEINPPEEEAAKKTQRRRA
jgi:hypothetical protein